MRWSKNVKREGDCPPQHLVGCMDSKYCILLGMAIYLECWLSEGGGNISQWMFLDGHTTSRDLTEAQDDEANKGKANYQNTLQKAINSDLFQQEDKPKKLGSHSCKKLASNMCIHGGCPSDDLDYRARWQKKRMQDFYTDAQKDWQDFNALQRLCAGGPIVYKEKDDSGVTPEWLAAEVTPAITAATFGRQVAVVFAKTLLWACFDANVADLVPLSLKNRIVHSYRGLSALEDKNPIQKVELFISNVNNVTCLQEIPVDETKLGLYAAREGQEWRNIMYAKMTTNQRNTSEIRNELLAHVADTKRELRLIKNMLRTLCGAPARRFQLGGGRVVPPQGAPNALRPATLAPLPRTIQALWDEYINGIGGRKPAQEFTRHERGGTNKFKYCNRKVLWGCMDRLTQRGNDVNTAIRRIENVYGAVTLSQLIRKMRQDERRGGHANLC